MSKTIPLIRAGALVPMMRWMSTQRRPVERALNDVGLGYAKFIDPNQPIPLRNAVRFYTNAAEAEGPDIGCRVISESSVLELAMIGKVALGAPTPRMALERVTAALPYHCSHEIVTTKLTGKGFVVSEGWTIRFDDTSLHVIQQFFSSVIQQICRLTHAPGPQISRIEMIAHPEFGMSHLEKWFPVTPVQSKKRVSQIWIDPSVADSNFVKIARDRTNGQIPPGMKKLSFDGSLIQSVKAVLRTQLVDSTPTIDDLAVSAGTSRRTLQRQLAAEGASFSGILEDIRQEIAFRHLEKDNISLNDIAARLGYAGQSTLTRAVRRWIGDTPSAVRSSAK